MSTSTTREPAQVRFYFDFLSPYAYLARHKLVELSRRHGWLIDYRSIDLALAKKAIGNTGPANRDMPVKLQYLSKDLTRWAASYGIELRFPPNYYSRWLNTGLYYGPCRGRETDYVRTAFNHVWGLGQAPDAAQTLSAVAEQMGWDTSEFAAFTDGEAGSQAYEHATAEAIANHVFGVPTMTVGEEMWWGNDRLFLLEQFLTKET